MKMEMAEAVVEKVMQLDAEEIRDYIGLSSEVENLGSELKQLQSFLKIHEQQQQQRLLLLHDDYDQEDADLVDKIMYRGLLKSQVQQQGVDLVGSWFMRSLLNLLFPLSYHPSTTEGEEAADLSRQIRLVNFRLLATVKAIHPPPPQGGQGQRAAGNLGDDWKSVPFDDDKEDIWNKDSTAVGVDDGFVVGREDAIEQVIYRDF